MNLGNALEAPLEGDWGLRLEEDYFEVLERAGFQSIRLPVSWTHHALRSAPYTIDESLFERVDWAVEQATERGLNLIINVHHYDELNANPSAESARFIGIWQQIAERYQNEGDDVYFELLNEPHEAFSPEVWNSLLAEALTEVRKTNPNRKVIVGPVNYNTVDALETLRLPADTNLIATVHIYDPFEFTHQGRGFDGSVGLPAGVTWDAARKQFAWQDWSWATGLEWRSDANGEDYAELSQEGYGGLYLHSENVLSGFDSLTFTTQDAGRFDVSCSVDGEPLVLKSVLTTKGLRDYSVDFSDCGAFNEITLQNDSPDPQVTRLYGLELLGPEKPLKLIATSAELLEQQLDKAFRWSQNNNIPIFVGEFGARDTADLASRVAWTRTMRQAFEAREFSWAYWEFGAEFGAYDVAERVWRPELLEALIP